MRETFFLLLAAIGVLLFIGTLFYHAVEEWPYIDAFYFSAISLATRGYGELHPTLAISKVFTVLYLFIGVGLILYALSSFIGYFMQYKEPALKERMGQWMRSIRSSPKREKWVVVSPQQKSEQNPFLKK